MKRSTKTQFAVRSLDCPEALEEFRQALKEFAAENLKTKETTLAALVRAGILTKNGNLTKRYR